MPETPTRRHAIEQLAASVRSLGDAAAETDIDPADIAAIATEIDTLRDRLAEAVHEDPYSGLASRPPDYSVPEGSMPLNPIIGACSPVRPDVSLHFDDGNVKGRARFTRRFVGPPGFVHGGISALLADQLVAVAPLARGLRMVTRELNVVYRRALPLGEEIELVGWCTEEGERAKAQAEIRAGGKVAVEASANLASYESLARKHGNGKS
jgi:uncharacterized protein (TIGR00369 family)